MMRNLIVLLAFSLCACGETDPDAFILEIVSASRESGQPAVAFSAIDELRVRIDPMENVRFGVRPEMVFEDGALLTRVSAEGEFIITALRPYLERYGVATADGFTIALPLQMESVMEGSVPAPTLVIEFIQRNADGTETIAMRRVELPWPLMASSQTVSLACMDGLEAKCANDRP